MMDDGTSLGFKTKMYLDRLFALIRRRLFLNSLEILNCTIHITCPHTTLVKIIESIIACAYNGCFIPGPFFGKYSHDIWKLRKLSGQKSSCLLARMLVTQLVLVKIKIKKFRN